MLDQIDFFVEEVKGMKVRRGGMIPIDNSEFLFYSRINVHICVTLTDCASMMLFFSVSCTYIYSYYREMDSFDEESGDNSEQR